MIGLSWDEVDGVMRRRVGGGRNSASYREKEGNG